MEERLFSEKYRPSQVNKMVLLPRIKEIILSKDGELQLPTSIGLTGTPGTGKTTLARIIEASYETLKINASLKSSVEDLKSEVMEFCQTMNVFSDNPNGMKVVFLDEFDGVSRQFQEGLRGFIEDYATRVRFIFTCNNISKIHEAIRSRMTIIDFTPRGNAESEFLRQGYARRLAAVAKAEAMEVSPEQIMSIVNASFPDYRSVFNKLQVLKVRGNVESLDELEGNADAGLLYALATGPIDPVASYDYVLATWGDKVDGLIALLGRPFAKWIFTQQPQNAFKVVRLLPLIRDYEINIQQATDPSMHAMALLYEVQVLFNEK